MENGKNEYFGKEKRRARRIAHPYVMRARQISPPVKSDQWIDPVLKDISKVGIAFCTTRKYIAGVVLEIELNNPLALQVQRLWATVVRCRQSEERGSVYDVAVNINKVEEPRELFDEVLDVLANKQEE